MHNEVGHFKTFGRTLGCLHPTQSKADQCWSKNCHFSSRSFETKDFKYKQKIPLKDRDWDQTVNVVTCETLASRSSALINDRASLFPCCIHAPFLFLTKPWVCPDRHPLSLVPTRQRGSQDPPCTSKGLISREHASRASYWPSIAHYLNQTKLTKGKESHSTVPDAGQKKMSCGYCLPSDHEESSLRTKPECQGWHDGGAIQRTKDPCDIPEPCPHILLGRW